MGTVIILLLILLVAIFAIQSSLKHFSGQGGCCGGSTEKVKRKKLKGPIVGTYEISIEGMHCENCKRAVEQALNDLDGVEARVNLKKARAIIHTSREVLGSEFANAITNAGYTVKEVKCLK